MTFTYMKKLGWVGLGVGASVSVPPVDWLLISKYMIFLYRGLLYKILK